MATQTSPLWRPDPVEGDAADEQAAVAVEGGHRVAGVGVGHRTAASHALGRGVLRVARDHEFDPGLAAVGRVSRSPPARAQVGQAVVVPAGHHHVRVGGIDDRERLVALAAAPTVVGVDVAVIGVVVGRRVGRRVVAVLDARSVPPSWRT